jgi:hypothetical protein
MKEHYAPTTSGEAGFSFPLTGFHLWPMEIEKSGERLFLKAGAWSHGTSCGPSRQLRPRTGGIIA